MSSPDRGLLRVVRTAAIAFCVVGLSLAAHLLAGGGTPGAATLLVTVAGVTLYAGALTRERLSGYQLIAVLGAGQVVLHTVFMLAGGHHAGGAIMIAAHAGAAVALGVALAYGERAVWGLWCWLHARLALPRVAPPEPAGPTTCLADTAVARAQLTWIGTSVMWRGPPAARSHQTH